MAEWVKLDRPKRKPRAGKRVVEAAAEEATTLLQGQRWEAMGPRHFVGLYVVLHTKVYGVPPGELAQAWPAAVRAAEAMLGREFGGERARMVAFIRWTWAREQRREQARGASDGRRIGWRLMFTEAGAGILTDYRTELARAQRTQARASARTS